MRFLLRVTFLGVFLFQAAAVVQAEVRMAGVFGDHMVLQRDSEVPVWGWAKPGAEITVSFGDQTQTTATADDGKWSVRLSPLSLGEPRELVVRGDGELRLQDVLVGEVWLCSGQSNMAMTVSRAKEFEQEKQKSNLPLIRHFKTAAHATPEKQDDCDGKWVVCSADTVGAFTATGFFFGRELHEELQVPIGLINSSWGGTDVAAWASLEAQQQQPAIAGKLASYGALVAAYDKAAAVKKHAIALEKWEERKSAALAQGKSAPRKPTLAGDPALNQNRPANLFNGMIHPLVPFAIRGAIWYQGERNSHSVSDGVLYETQLKTLINDWRSQWSQGDFPFGTVQLPNFHGLQTQPVETSGWVMVRESELKSLDLPNTGVAVTTDVGEAKDIHPKNKQTVGHRLALWALATTYGRELEYSGPMLASHKVFAPTKNEAGEVDKAGRLAIKFAHADGLKTTDGEKLRGFAVAGEDGVFHNANARVNKNTGAVVVSQRKVPVPVAVRYNWADNPIGNLINEAGLPASPFRTDGWDLAE